MPIMKTLSINNVKYDIDDANAVKFTEQALTNEQKAQARTNINAMDNEFSIHNDEVVYSNSDNYTIQVTNVQTIGRLCMFCLQIVINTAISSNYGFTLATMPFAPTMRIWINNETQFYMDAGSKDVRVNGSSLGTGSYKLTGIYFISE